MSSSTISIMSDSSILGTAGVDYDGTRSSNSESSVNYSQCDHQSDFHEKKPLGFKIGFAGFLFFHNARFNWFVQRYALKKPENEFSGL